MSSSNDFAIRGVSRNELFDTAIWGDKLWPVLKPAMNHGWNEHDDESLFRALINRDMQCWAIESEDGIDAVFITEIVDYPCVRMCRVAYCAGKNMRGWKKHIDKLKEWAKGMDCAIFEVVGRKGWERELQEFGFENGYTSVRAQL